MCFHVNGNKDYVKYNVLSTYYILIAHKPFLALLLQHVHDNSIPTLKIIFELSLKKPIRYFYKYNYILHNLHI